MQGGTTMTKLFLAASILLLTFFPEAFDKEKKKKKKEKARTEVSYHAEQAFISQFGYSKTVRWETVNNDLYRAYFKIDEEDASAFFAPDGRYVAHTVKKEIHQLPIKLRVAISNQFAEKELGEIIQMFSPNEACWYIEVPKENGTEIWKGLSYGTLSLHELKAS